MGAPQRTPTWEMPTEVLDSFPVWDNIPKQAYDRQEVKGGRTSSKKVWLVAVNWIKVKETLSLYS